MKILIDKEKLEDELNKLGQQTSYDEWEQGRKTGKMEVLESILQQGEEYNENEASKVTRLEVIDHSPEGKGRAYVQRDIKELELSYQDNGKTLKIFIK